YGKFLDVDVGPYLEAFETSEHVTVDGYSYLQEEPAPAPVRAPVVRRRPSRPAAPSRSSSSNGSRPSLLPLIIGLVVIAAGFWIGKLLVNLRRLAPQTQKAPAVVQTPARPTTTSSGPYTATAPIPAQSPPDRKVAASTPAPPPASTPAAAASAPPVDAPTPAVAAASPPAASPASAPAEPEVRRAEPVRAEDLNKAAEPAGPNRIAIRPLKKTYIKVVIDNEQTVPAFERWVSPSDGTLEFRGQRVSVRVLDREAVQIKKNGKSIEGEDSDVSVE
ncbi:MAG TPA: hypothetical protein VJ719_15845, partial [Chthoniobacterales bacterium]|nr:hypothetical protein [Chthoniobacterales bacterium]